MPVLREPSAPSKHVASEQVNDEPEAGPLGGTPAHLKKKKKFKEYSVDIHTYCRTTAIRLTTSVTSVSFHSVFAVGTHSSLLICPYPSLTCRREHVYICAHCIPRKENGASVVSAPSSTCPTVGQPCTTTFCGVTGQ